MFRSFVILALVLSLAALLGVACGSPPAELDGDQAKFRSMVLEIIEHEQKIFEPMLGKGESGPAIQKNIDQQFTQALAQGKPLYYDLAVLDKQVTILGWRSPDPSDLSQTYQGFVGQNYSKFQKMDPVFKDEHIAAFEVFTQYGPGYGICAPLLSDSKLVGALCLGFDYNLVTKRYGLSKDKLLAIDFNK